MLVSYWAGMTGRKFNSTDGHQMAAGFDGRKNQEQAERVGDGWLAIKYKVWIR